MIAISLGESEKEYIMQAGVTSDGIPLQIMLESSTTSNIMPHPLRHLNGKGEITRTYSGWWLFRPYPAYKQTCPAMWGKLEHKPVVPVARKPRQLQLFKEVV